MAVQNKYIDMLHAGDVRGLVSPALPSLPNTYNKYKPSTGFNEDQQQQFINSLSHSALNPMYMSNTTNPLAYNSLADIIFNYGAQKERWEDTWLDPDHVVTAPIRWIADTYFMAKNQIYDPIAGSIKLANKNPNDDYTLGKAFSQGTATAGMNLLVNLGNTLDIFANPIKGFIIEGFIQGNNPFEGFYRGLVGGRQGRKQYDYMDYVDDKITSFVLEYFSDPLNLISIGTGRVAKHAIDAMADTTAAATKASVNELVERGLKQAGKSLTQADGVVKSAANWVFDDGSDALEFVMKRFKWDENQAENFIKSITTNGVADPSKVDDMLKAFRAGEADVLTQLYRNSQFDDATLKNVKDSLGGMSKYNYAAKELSPEMGRATRDLLLSQIPDTMDDSFKVLSRLHRWGRLDNEFTKLVMKTNPISLPLYGGYRAIKNAFKSRATTRTIARLTDDIVDLIKGKSGINFEDISDIKKAVTLVDMSKSTVDTISEDNLKTIQKELLDLYNKESDKLIDILRTVSESGAPALKDIDAAQAAIDSFRKQMQVIVKYNSGFKSVDDFITAFKGVPEFKSFTALMESFNEFAYKQINQSHFDIFKTALSKRSVDLAQELTEKGGKATALQDKNLSNALARFGYAATGRYTVPNWDELVDTTISQIRSTDLEPIYNIIKSLDTTVDDFKGADVTTIGSIRQELLENMAEFQEIQKSLVASKVFKNSDVTDSQRIIDASELFSKIQDQLDSLQKIYPDVFKDEPFKLKTSPLNIPYDSVEGFDISKINDPFLRKFFEDPKNRAWYDAELAKVQAFDPDRTVKFNTKAFDKGEMPKTLFDHREVFDAWLEAQRTGLPIDLPPRMAIVGGMRYIVDPIPYIMSQPIQDYLKAYGKPLINKDSLTLSKLISELPDVTDLSKVDTLENIYDYVDNGYIEYVTMRSRTQITEQIANLDEMRKLLAMYKDPNSDFARLFTDSAFKDKPEVLQLKDSLERLQTYIDLHDELLPSIQSALVKSGFTPDNAALYAERVWDSALNYFERSNSFIGVNAVKNIDELLSKANLSLNSILDTPSAKMDYLLSKAGIDITSAHRADIDINNWITLALKKDNPFGELYTAKVKGKLQLVIDLETTSTNLLNAEVYQIAVRLIDDAGHDVATPKLYDIRLKNTLPDFSFLNARGMSVDEFKAKYMVAKNTPGIYNSVSDALADIQQNVLSKAGKRPVVITGHNIRDFDLKLLERTGRDMYDIMFAPLVKQDAVFDSYLDTAQSVFHLQDYETTAMRNLLLEMFSDPKYTKLTQRVGVGKVWGFADNKNLADVARLLDDTEFADTTKAVKFVDDVSEGISDYERQVRKAVDYVTLHKGELTTEELIQTAAHLYGLDLDIADATVKSIIKAEEFDIHSFRASLDQIARAESDVAPVVQEFKKQYTQKTFDRAVRTYLADIDVADNYRAARSAIEAIDAVGAVLGHKVEKPWGKRLRDLYTTLINQPIESKDYTTTVTKWSTFYTVTDVRPVRKDLADQIIKQSPNKVYSSDVLLRETIRGDNKYQKWFRLHPDGSAEIRTYEIPSYTQTIKHSVEESRQAWLDTFNKFRKTLRRSARPESVFGVTEYPTTMAGWKKLMRASEIVDSTEALKAGTIKHRGTVLQQSLREAKDAVYGVWNEVATQGKQTIRISAKQASEEGVSIMRELNKGLIQRDGIWVTVKRVRDTSFANYFDIDKIAKTYGSMYGGKHIPLQAITELTAASRKIAAQHSLLSIGVSNTLYDSARHVLGYLVDHPEVFQGNLIGSYFKYLNPDILADKVTTVAIARSYLPNLRGVLDPKIKPFIDQLSDLDAAYSAAGSEWIKMNEIAQAALKKDPEAVVDLTVESCAENTSKLRFDVAEVLDQVHGKFEGRGTYSALEGALNAAIEDFSKPLDEFTVVLSKTTPETRAAAMVGLHQSDVLLTAAQEKIFLDPDTYKKHLPFTKLGKFVVGAPTPEELLYKVRAYQNNPEFVLSAVQRMAGDGSYYIGVAIKSDAYDTVIKQIDETSELAQWYSKPQTLIPNDAPDLIYKPLVTERTGLNNLIKNVGYSPGNVGTIEMSKQIDEALFNGRSDIVTTAFLQEHGVFDAPIPNHMIVGGMSLQRHFDPYFSNNALFRIQNSFAQQVAPRIKDTALYLNFFISDSTDIAKSDFLKQLRPEQLLQVLNHPDSGVRLMVVRAARGGLEQTSTGIVCEVVNPTTVEEITKLRKAGAHIVPVEFIPDIVKSVNDFKLPRWVEFIRQVSLGYKIGYLGPFGWPLRNAIDSYVKNIAEKEFDSPVHVGRDVGQVFKAEKILRNYNQLMAHHGAWIKTIEDYDLLLDYFELGEEGFRKQYLNIVTEAPADASAELFRRVSAAKTKKELAEKILDLSIDDKTLLQKNLLSREMFELTHNFVQFGPSAGLADSVKEYFFQNSKKVLKDAADPYATKDAVDTLKEFNNWVLEKTPVKHVFSANQHIEQAARFNLYLSELNRGASISQATRKVIETHFDYADKSLIMTYIDVIFPFMSFSFKNLTYWAERVIKTPRLAGAVTDCLKVVLDYNSLFEPDYEAYHNFDYGYDAQDWGKASQPWQQINAARLFHLLQGNILWDSGKDVMHDSGYGERMTDLYNVFKLSPSVLDAYTLLTRPLDSFEQRLLPPFRPLWNIVTGESNIQKSLQDLTLINNLPYVGASLTRIGARIGLFEQGLTSNNMLQRVEDAGFHQAISSVFGAAYVPHKKYNTWFGPEFDYLTELPQSSYSNSPYYKSGGFTPNYYATRTYSDPYSFDNPTYRINKLARNTKPKDLYSRSKRHNVKNVYSDLFRNQLTFNQLKYRTLDQHYYH